MSSNTEVKFLTKVANRICRRRRRRRKCISIQEFLHQIHQRKWRKVKKALRSSAAAHLCSISDQTGLYALGAAVGYNAPFEIIKAIFDFHPEAAIRPDDYGSLPLHIGCLNGSHPQVIELLLSQENQNNEISSYLDINKQSPLHYAVDFLCGNVNNDIIPPKPPQQIAHSPTSDERSKSFPSIWLYVNDDFYFDTLIRNAIAVIELLCTRAPECVCLVNRDGETPIDLIQNKKLLITKEENLQVIEYIYQHMNKTATLDYRRRKAKWEEEGYDTRLPKRPFSSVDSENSSSEVVSSTGSSNKL